MNVRDFIAKKVPYVYTTDTIQTVVDTMATSNHGFVVVYNVPGEKTVVGVISNKDIINKVIAKKKSLTETTAGSIMVKKYVWTTSTNSVSDTLLLMKKHNIKRVLVIDDETLKGLISYRDIMDCMLKKKKELLDFAIDF